MPAIPLNGCKGALRCTHRWSVLQICLLLTQLIACSTWITWRNISWGKAAFKSTSFWAHHIHSKLDPLEGRFTFEMVCSCWSSLVFQQGPSYFLVSCYVFCVASTRQAAPSIQWAAMTWASLGKPCHQVSLHFQKKSHACGDRLATSCKQVIFNLKVHHN